MTSIERTAYPRLNTNRIISSKGLEENYTLFEDEIGHIKSTVESNKERLHYALQLKTLQYLGFFIEVDQIPPVIVMHLRKQLGIPHNTSVIALQGSTLYRRRQLIREYLGYTPWSSSGKGSAGRMAIKIAFNAAETLNIPADIINVVIEELMAHRFELPAFSTLCRLVRHVRSKVNSSIFQAIFNQLVDADKIKPLEEVISVPPGQSYSPYQSLKKSPKSPRINNFKDLIRHHAWLLTLGDMSPFLKSISRPKYLQFVEEAKSLDISNLMDLSDPRRYTLIAYLIDYTQKQTKDHLAEMLCKTINTAHKRARMALSALREKKSDQTYEVASLMRRVLGAFKDYAEEPTQFIANVSSTIKGYGGVDTLMDRCDGIIACHSNQHYSLMWTYFKPRRAALMDVIEAVQLGSSTQNENLIGALNFLISNRYRRVEMLKAADGLNLNFISDAWRQLVYDGNPEQNILNRRFFEMCVFTYLSYELTSGDVFIQGADAFSDYRASLLSYQECQDILKKEPEKSILISSADEFIQDIKNDFKQKAQVFDDLYPSIPDFVINDKGMPSLKRTPTIKPAAKTLELIAMIQNNMPERSVLDILCSTHHITGWAHEFGSMSGSQARFEQPTDRYILTTFCHGTGMGPTQTAKHVRSNITPHMLMWVNQRHVNINMLNKAKDRVINCTKHFLITTAWGDSSRCAADGTLCDIYNDNLMAEAHFRYVSKGGIAYHHISDTYVALFSTFMRCGLWEAVSILEGLLKNDSDIKPTTVHADTQGQSTVVFGLAHLLGIKLMPRIRNWKDLKFFKPDKNITYKNVDCLFSDSIDWELLRTHWQDLIQVVLSIKKGKISSTLLLRKLGTYSRKNKLYLAFQELGRVVRTTFLLEYLSKPKLREIITATTNKVESYNALSQWVRFASDVIVANNDVDEMEKAVKYNLLINNSIILQNIIDLTNTIHKLQKSGVHISKEDIALLSPYLTGHIKRFGDIIFDFDTKPIDVERIKNLSIFT